MGNIIFAASEEVIQADNLYYVDVGGDLIDDLNCVVMIP